MRLSAEDRLNLMVETPETPINVAALAILDRPGDTAAIRAEVGRRLRDVPALCQVLARRGRLRWTPASRLLIVDHVRESTVAAPGDEEALLRMVARLIVQPMDRSRPLWRMWLIRGLPGDRLAVLFVLHHVVADGLTAINMINILLGGTPTVSPPRAVPRGRWLPDAGLLRTALSGRRTPDAGLNRPVGSHRRLATVHLDLDAARQVAHRHGATVNDLVLALAAGGVRALLGTRHQDPGGLRVRASVAVSLRTGEEPGNRTGALIVALPVAVPETGARLDEVAAATARAKNGQPPAAPTAVLTVLGRLGLARPLSRHQRLITVVESSLIGPASPIRLLGARVQAITAIGNLAGNVGLSFVALSYAGRLTLTVHADAAAFPDLPVLVDAIRADWAALRSPADGIGVR
ncbi:wax ester/triacylglycerol synthase domain-containing protein [Actinoplanes sp. NBRC 101535]|uniref:wax ester/triacylglycerol synthase domain-containing protein n=1 Tax=Actinoplanes sp. NBRC 101535 TaxID=3032196 RepID=UPI0024A4D729|nr:wax ester/triacylglycerol synthase domain-containing protein [Actinoplanes sp. NBRC 101535]GLY08735.1 diacylglycerol O-acyltransferase [Actinoplanes sp. NBRC 101535]